jgi:hypothetical protein
VLTGLLDGMVRRRVAVSVTGVLAAIAAVIVGCSSVTDGSALVDKADAPAYRASVSESVEASESKSIARESDRQASLTTQAVRSVCEDMSSTSADAIKATNDYVGALNANGDAAAMAGPAIDALNRSADLVSGGLDPAVSPPLRDSLSAWVDAARGVADAISTNAGPDEFNAAGDRVNESRNQALNLCDDAY